jgi:hypothetical protein
MLTASGSESPLTVTDSTALPVDQSPHKKTWQLLPLYLRDALAHRAESGPKKFWLFFAAVGFIYLAALFGLDFLRFPIGHDETHFWPTTIYLFQDGFPSFDRLRSYNELNTPLPFLVFGVFEHYFHGGILVGRFINLLTSFAVVLLIGAAGRFSFYSTLCAIGLIACPYFLAVSTHLFTDVMAVAFVVAGVSLYLKNRPGFAALSFIFAISCRQYTVVFPIGTILYNLVNWRVSGKHVWWSWLAPAFATATLGAWALFFGAMAPRVALENQYITVGRFFPAHGLYFLTCIGLYFVVIELLLFWASAGLKDFKITKLAIAIVISGCFLVYPPIGNLDQHIQPMGYLDLAARLIMGDKERIALFWSLAILTCFRFSPLSLAGILLYLNVALMVMAHIAWDKYALPLLAVLWLLKSAGKLDAREPELQSKELIVPS